MAERRGYTRSRVLKGAKLIVGCSAVLDCVVRNLTNVGARIEIPNTVDLPDKFDMTFDRGRSRRPRRVVWRRLNEAGVKFFC